MNQVVLTTPISEKMIASLCAGDRVLLSGAVYTARDAAHKRLMALVEKSERLPLDLSGQVMYYCGPTPAKPDRVIGSAGPTTSSRMDGYTPEFLKATGLKAMIGKGNRSPAVVEAMVKNKCVYFAAVGGCGALIAKAVVASSVVCYEDLGPEAVCRLEVRNMPLIVAIDSNGNNLYTDGPKEFRKSKN
jgi:fumarate hydratase subunit beta